MAKFESDLVDLVVSTENGFITFKDGLYTTTNKKEIEALKNSKGVKELNVKTTLKSKLQTSLTPE